MQFFLLVVLFVINSVLQAHEGHSPSEGSKKSNISASLIPKVKKKEITFLKQKVNNKDKIQGIYYVPKKIFKDSKLDIKFNFYSPELKYDRILKDQIKNHIFFQSFEKTLEK